MKRAYIKKDFRPETMERIARAVAIVEEYARDSYALTLRQLYYQHVARGLIENNQREYDRLGSIVVDARMCGMMDWEAIEDRTRNLSSWHYWESPRQALTDLSRTYRMDKWSHQRMRPEVWVEKEAMEGVVERICGQLQVDFFCCRGYVSKSEMWRAGMRFSDRIRRGQTPVVLHLGDHDPSGIDMTRDNATQLLTFTGVQVQVVRLALNMSQVETFRPPPNPAKTTDSRFADYQRLYGDESWELDALQPQTIHDLIRSAVDQMRDERQWNESLEQENADRAWLRHTSGEESSDEQE